MIESRARDNTTTGKPIENATTLKISQQTEESLQQCLTLFDFSIPLREKNKGEWRLFYNNCNGLEVNAMISTYIKQKKDKWKYNYLIDNEAPTKLDSLLRQMKI